MKTLQPLIFLLITTPALAGGHLHPERWYQEQWCEAMGGQTEVVLPDKTRVDCLTDEYAIEVDFAPKWAEGIGQALHYSLMTGKKPGVLLVLERQSDQRHLIRLKQVGKARNIAIWTMNEEGEFFAYNSGESDMNTLFREILTALLVAGFGAVFSLWFYFRQKEYALVKKRYLEGAIDLVASELENAFGVESHNWARCLHLVKTYRDQKEEFDVKELSTGFLDFDTSKFLEIAHYRLRALIGSSIMWEVYQLALAYCDKANFEFTKEVPEAIRRHRNGRIQGDHQEFVNRIFKDLNRRQEEGRRYAIMTKELQNLAFSLETKRLSFKGIAKFHKSPKTQEALRKLHDEFQKDLL